MKFFFNISFILFIAQFATSQKDSIPKRKNDSLNAYVFPDFRDMDTNMRNIYDFVDYSKNNYQFFTKESPNFEHLYLKLNQLITTKKGKLNFYHIGGSHLQADIYTNDVRVYLQSRWDGVTGERGWVFPFDLAKTNNPGNYEFKSPNTWTPYRSVAQKPSKVDIDYGILGYAITCSDSAMQIYFNHDRTKVRPEFNHLRIFHNIGEFPFWMHFGEDDLLVEKITQNKEKGYSDIYFTDPLDSLDVQIARLQKEGPDLEVYGFLMMNDEPGISYTSIGVNGAGLYSYLGNIRFEEQLKTYPPDFFAYSVGTNDGNVQYSDFRPDVYKRNLEKIMQMALRANPKCALLLTVPNDAYYYRRYPNKNIAREREVIIELAKEYKMAVWDLYGLMGGLGSSKTWKLKGLMRSDYIHFTFPGYHFKGELYIDALLKYMDQMELSKNEIE